MQNNLVLGGVGVVAALALVLSLLGGDGGVTREYVDSALSTLGAQSSPESTNDYQCYAGICTHYRKASFIQVEASGAKGSTTPLGVAMRAPTHATSSFTGYCNVTASTGTAGVVTISHGASPYATSTLNGNPLMVLTIPANQKLAFNIASTSGILAADTPAGLMRATSTIFAPGDYLQFGVQGAPGANGTHGFVYGGGCVGEFKTAF